MKKASNVKVKQKRNGKFFVRTRGGKPLNGAEKIKVLVAQGKMKETKPKSKDAPAEGAT